MVVGESGYRGLVSRLLVQIGANVGDRICITDSKRKFEGIIMPRAQIGVDSNHLVIKLDSGYNIGVRVSENTMISLVSKFKKQRPKKTVQTDTMESLPNVSIVSTGGTIASKVDYRTGAVHPALTAQDLYDAVPELGEYANIRATVLMSKFSENLAPCDWSVIAKKVASEIRTGVDGVIVAHGTDTLGFTAAALSFALHNLPVPVVLVGSQRSSDRPSSDAALNLISAAQVASNANVAEVLLVMHGTTDDTYALAHRGTRVRKCHTSRRDAFQSIDCNPVLKIDDGCILELSPPLLRRDSTRKVKVKPRFEEKVALIKAYPGFSGDVFHFLQGSGYRGVVIEGTGLGHVSKDACSIINDVIDDGMIVAMSSQCIWGRVDMNVYRSGVELLNLGVIPCDNMLPETALVKLMWLLANVRDTEQVRNKLTRSLVGEISPRTEIDAISIRRF